MERDGSERAEQAHEHEHVHVHEQEHVKVDERGGVLRIVLNRPKGNVLDMAMLGAISAALEGADELVKVVVFEGAGANFCFGASVAEHVRERAPSMLKQFHGLFRRLARLSIPTAAIVRGACLGGGCELAAWCTWVFASPEARFGQPEVRLGVVPPIASLVLPWRLGGGRGLDLCVSGRSLSAQEALAFGLVNEVADDPAAACAAFLAKNVLPSSASSLRFAERAGRAALYRLVESELPRLEELYLDELMATPDANEGIAAFLEKRAPVWASGASS